MFSPVFFGSASLSKLDLLYQYDFFQNPSASSPLTYTDDPSTALTHIPNERFAAAEKQKGNIPLWNQLNGGGRPFFGEFQTMVWSFFHALFPSNNKWLYNLSLLFKLYAAALGTYFLARRLTLDTWSSFAAAAAFMLCPRNLHWLELCNNVFFYPWLLLLFCWLAKEPRVWKSTLAGLITGAVAYNIHPETYACATILAAVISLDEFRKFQPTLIRALGCWLLHCAIAALISALIAAPLLATFAEFISLSESYKFEKHAPTFLPLSDFLSSLVLPSGDLSVYCGPVIGALWIIGCVALRQRGMFLACFFLLLLFCVRPFGLAAFFLEKPFLYLLPEYPIAATILFQALLGGAGLSFLCATLKKFDVYIRQKMLVRLLVWTLAIFVPAIFCIFSLLAQTKIAADVLSRFTDTAYDGSDIATCLFVPTALLLTATIYLSWRTQKRAAATCILKIILACGNTLLLAVVSFDQIPPRAAAQYRPHEYLKLVKSTDSRMVATGCQLFQPDSNLIYGIDDYRSLAPLHPLRYSAYADAAGIHPRISFMQECPSKLNNLFDLASIRYILSDRCVERLPYLDTTPPKSIDIPPAVGAVKLAEGFRIDSVRFAYIPERHCLDVKLLFTMRPDINNRYYCKFFLTSSSGKELSANAWPYLSLEQEGSRQKNYSYFWQTSLVVPRELADGSKVYINAYIKDRWMNKFLSNLGASSGQTSSFRLGELSAVKAANKGALQIVRDNADGLVLYENTQAKPRAYLDHSPDFSQSQNQSLRLLLSNRNLRRPPTIIETGQPASAFQVASSPSDKGQEQCRIIERNSQTVSLAVRCTNPGFLILTDTFYPGWNAYIDGKASRIYPANLAFRAIHMDEGTHTVVFKYEPESFRLGVLLMQIGIISSVFAMFLSMFINKTRKKS